MELVMAVETTMFTCVNPGYSGKGEIHTHEAATDLVNKTLSFIKRSGGADPNEYKTYSSLIVWDPTLGCAEGGEIAVAVVTPGKLSSVSAMAERLRSKLEQSSLSVAGSPEEGSATTRGLWIETKGDVAVIAKLWQQKATVIKNETITKANPYGTYVSAGIYDADNGKVVIQGEANPRYFPTDESRQAWESAAVKVAAAVATELKQEMKPEFRDMGFNYLRAKEMPNSRGELS
jgi:hypothetical protein